VIPVPPAIMPTLLNCFEIKRRGLGLKLELSKK